jgi:hypothetical protein
MAQNQGASSIDAKLSAAKKTLAHANAFSAKMPKMAAPAPAAAAPKPPAPKPPSNPEGDIGAELAAKARNVSSYTDAPKMHNGGPVVTDGVYQLKRGEHVLTEAEAKQARKHALAAAGMKSLARAGQQAGSKPDADATPKPVNKKSVASIKVKK